MIYNYFYSVGIYFAFLDRKWTSLRRNKDQDKISWSVFETFDDLYEQIFEDIGNEEIFQNPLSA